MQFYTFLDNKEIFLLSLFSVRYFLIIKIPISLVHNVEYIPAIIATTTPAVVAARITTQLSLGSSSHGHLTRKRGIAHVIESRNWHVSVGYNEPAANYTLDHPTSRSYASSAFYGAVHRRWMNRKCVRKRSAKCYGYSVETRSLKWE